MPVGHLGCLRTRFLFPYCPNRCESRSIQALLSFPLRGTVRYPAVTGPVELYKSTGDRTSLSRTIALLSNRVILTLVGLSGNPLKLNKKDVSPTLGGPAEELVATYMGRLKTVGPGGELISIVAPSEPWLRFVARSIVIVAL